MKKVAFAFGLLLFILLGGILLVPVIFKDEILEKVKSVANEQVNAKVNFRDADISVLSHFPMLTAALEELEIVGNKPFDRDTLIRSERMEVGLNLWDILTNSENPAIEYIGVKNADIYLHVLKDGRANWDIALPDTSVQEETADTSAFNLKLKKYELENINLIYNDKSLKTYVEVQNLNHGGKGDFTQDVFDLETNTEIGALTVDYEGTKYFNKTRVEADVRMNIDMTSEKYTFSENRFRFNDFEFSIDGFFQMLKDETYAMNLSMNIPETDFKHLISLIPAVYLKDYENLKTGGKFSFEAKVDGNYSENHYPNFELRLLVKNGFLKYPELPSEVKQIDIDLSVKNKDAAMQSLEINVPKFYVHSAGALVNGDFNMKGLEAPVYKTNLKAEIDLAKLIQAIPFEGYKLRGKINGTLAVAGQYIDSTSMPKINALFQASDIYAKAEEYPHEISGMKFLLKAENPDNTLEKFRLEIPEFFFKLDEDPLEGQLTVVNALNPTFRFTMNGKLDLGKFSKLYPLEDAEYKGLMKIVADIQGDMESIEKEKYQNIKAFGNVSLENFEYKGPELPEVVKIVSAKLDFSPKALQLREYKSFIGKSDLNMTGSIGNYLGYALADGKLKGNVSLTSAYLNLNALMSEEGETETSEQDTTQLEAPEIPENIEFTAQANIKKMLYDTYDLRDFQGKLIIKDKKLLIERTTFKTLGAKFTMTGEYSTENPKKPFSAFGMKIENLKIKTAFDNIETFKKLVPIAGYADGIVDLDFKFSTELTSTLEPVYETLTAQGVSFVKNTTVKGAPPLQSLAQKTKLSNLSTIKVANQVIKFKIENGKLLVEPFDLNLNGTKLTIGGANRIDGNIDYLLEMDAPMNRLGKEAASTLLGFAGMRNAAPSRVKLKFKLFGPFTKPKVVPVGAEGGAGESVKENLQNRVEQKREEVKEQINEVKQQTQQEIEQRKKEIEDSLRKVKEQKEKELRIRKQIAELQAKLRTKEEALKQVRAQLRNVNDKLKKANFAEKIALKKTKQTLEKKERQLAQEVQNLKTQIKNLEARL